MSGDAEDADLIQGLKRLVDGLTGADRIRATVIIDRAASLRRPLMAGWQAEAREIMARRSAETEALAQALGFGSRQGGEGR